MKTKTKPNRMIVIDGVDGSGKGVQTRRLLQSFVDAGEPAILTREPGGCAAAEEIRALLVTGEPEKWDSMTELLLEGCACNTVLEIGTGSGYQTAVLASLMRRVYSIERIGTLHLEGPGRGKGEEMLYQTHSHETNWKMIRSYCRQRHVTI